MRNTPGPYSSLDLLMNKLIQRMNANEELSPCDVMFAFGIAMGIYDENGRLRNRLDEVLMELRRLQPPEPGADDIATADPTDRSTS